MGWFRQLFSRRRRYDELSESIREHLDEKIEDMIDRGMTREKAERRARCEFGNVTLIEQRSREVWQWPTLESFWIDICYALRQIERSPGFSCIVICMLALGFGVSVAIFSIVRTVLLSPLPFRDPGRLVQIVSWWPKTGNQTDWSAPLLDAIDWKATVPAFQDVAMYHYDLHNLTGKGEAESVYGLRVTASLLPMLGVHPQLGNWFSADHDLPGNTHVVILSDDLWRRRFGADTGIIGKTIHLDEEGYEVVAVMPRGFNFPLKLGTTALLPTDQMQFWTPLALDLATLKHGAQDGGVIARLKPGVTLGEAQAELGIACRLLERQYPETNRDLSARIFSLHQLTVSRVNLPLLALLAATGLILLLACANVAALLLARSALRYGELAIRMALGGSAWQVARIPMLEGILLCCCGCLLGIPAATASVKLLLRLAPIDVPRLADTSVDFKAVLFAALLAIGCGVLIGGLNALQVLGRSPREVLSEASRSSLGRPRTRLRSSLIVGQVTLAVVLLSMAGLMLDTLANLRSTDTGYRGDHAFYAVTVLTAPQYRQFDQRQVFFRKVLHRLRNTPGIKVASVSTGFPYVGQYGGVNAQSVSMARNGSHAGVEAEFNAVSSDYLEAMGVRLIGGRLIAETDKSNTPKVAVIDETLARALWPTEDALGKMINTDDPAKPVWRQVVGVLAPMRNKSIDVAARPGIFIPLDQSAGNVNFVVIKASVSAREAARLIKSAVGSVDANQDVFFVQSVRELIGDTIAVRRFLFLVLAFFGGAALTLSVIGIYGLVSFIAVRRAREVGIRMALGATRGSVARLMVLHGAHLALFGAIGGLCLSIVLNHLISSMLFGVGVFDVKTAIMVITAVAAGTLIATFIPAWRTAKLQPLQALRTE
jgi:predicted permease